MFSMRVKTRTSRHETECERAEETIAAQEPLDTTNEHCRKSPRRQPLYYQRANMGVV
jgi:hypothetical protein